MAKRTSIKGKDADIFWDTEHHKTGATAGQKSVNTVTHPGRQHVGE
jgi:hypothetical protein